MRRAEMARRRKNLSEKRNEEEKVCFLLGNIIYELTFLQMETINKLLKKQAPKTNARRNNFNTVPGEGTPDSDGAKPDAGFVRWVSSKDGNRIGVPEEWLEAPVGGIFERSVKPAGGVGGKLIQEVA